MFRGLALNCSRSSSFYVAVKSSISRNMCAHVLCLYLCKKIETAQLADNTVHLRKSLPLSTGLKETVSNDKKEETEMSLQHH